MRKNTAVAVAVMLVVLVLPLSVEVEAGEDLFLRYTAEEWQVFTELSVALTEFRIPLFANFSRQDVRGAFEKVFVTGGRADKEWTRWLQTAVDLSSKGKVSLCEAYPKKWYHNFTRTDVPSLFLVIRGHKVEQVVMISTGAQLVEFVK